MGRAPSRDDDGAMTDTSLLDPVAVSYRYAAGFDFVAGGLFWAE